MKPSTVYSYMKLLEENGNITIKSNNKFSLVTVVNWELYQTDNENSNNRITTKWQQNNNKITQTRNIKNIKNISSRNYDEKFFNEIYANDN